MIGYLVAGPSVKNPITLVKLRNVKTERAKSHHC